MLLEDAWPDPEPAAVAEEEGATGVGGADSLKSAGELSLSLGEERYRAKAVLLDGVMGL